MSVQTITSMPETIPAILTDVTSRAIIQTFEKMIGETSVSSIETEIAEVEGIVALISFVGDLTWSLAMRFPQQTAVNLAHKFAGFEIEYESADMGDVAGEFANVLAGVICGELENEGMYSQMSLPTVTRGKQFSLLLGGHLVAQRLCISSDGNPFTVRLIVSKNSRSGSSFL